MVSCWGFDVAPCTTASLLDIKAPLQEYRDLLVLGSRTELRNSNLFQTEEHKHYKHRQSDQVLSPADSKLISQPSYTHPRLHQQTLGMVPYNNLLV